MNLKDKLDKSYLFILLILSLLIFFSAYIYPRSTFWDENYYACAVFKYLNGIFFFESHPPLGKMIMALGEWLMPINQKIDTSVFLSTNYLKSFPENFSFAGLRLFPNLFNVANTFLFFFILLSLLKNKHIAFFLTSLYLFNNGYILHARGAMIDSTQIFFIFIAILYFLKILSARENLFITENNFTNKNSTEKKISPKKYFLLAIPLGLAITTKVNAVIFLLLFVFLFFYDYAEETKKVISSIFKFFFGLFVFIGEKKFFKKKKSVKNSVKNVDENLTADLKENLKENTNEFFLQKKEAKLAFKIFFQSLAIKSLLSIVGLLLVFFVVFYIHGKLTTKVYENRYYDASESYRKILKDNQKDNKGISFYHVPLLIKEYYLYMEDYHTRVPKLDKCKDKENGSYPLEWILGAKAIKYSWYGLSGGGFYLYSVPNFLVLMFGLFGLISSISLLVAVLLFGLKIGDKSSFLRILFFTILYLCYMGFMLSIDRVMYLYHYFLPTFLSLFMGISIFRYIFNREMDQNNRKTYMAVMIFALQIIVVFIYFGGFSYGWFNTINDFTDKTWLPIWNLKY